VRVVVDQQHPHRTVRLAAQKGGQVMACVVVVLAAPPMSVKPSQSVVEFMFSPTTRRL
jgi:hypothetical protein